ncbi:single-stranded-DNA-specific exonuclease RecJ [Paenibacillus segetis]|uniref:Single-stranded-DNA-specific exonuclease RecJ n=1 Tax=Paenibacillus segetis TaxID=1325360 RepID=A0ABQ1YLZ9_9BACL|nr:single-stranded-DNA-specific exonuclease RecJ [Paenibacillus segetis]GGH29553.1 single-stranded-DNA-specific exonuclease RecJ [Paenibacillus segetis]
MLHPKYHWESLQTDEDKARLLSDQLNISPLVASLLITRGIRDLDEGKRFLYGTLADLHDPLLMSGMKEAVERIRAAVENGERILIYGDYDADGVSSTALMIHLMTRLGANFDYYIPHRSKEGYGLHIHALEQFYESGFTLVVTVDTGISAVEQVAYANSVGMDVIVTDHHEPPSKLPEAFALINPKLPYCSYPFKGLAGVGVAYKLAQALLGGDTPMEWTELVALGTVADLMPLVEENRLIVTYGLKSMGHSAFPGLTALLSVAGSIKEQVSSTNVAFGLAPRINASGRMSHANRAVELLTTSSAQDAELIANELDILNKERQLLVENIVEEALLQLAAKEAAGHLPDVIVVAGEGWNVGVVGIVASKILERYYRPTIVLGIHPESGECKGSARSIPGFDIYEALTHCADLLDHYGGHPAAAGMSLPKDHLVNFEQRLGEYATDILRPEHFVPTMLTDIECSLEEVTLPVIEQLEELAPFGMGNTYPRLLIRGVKLLECRQMGKEGKHLKLNVSHNGTSIEAVAFGKGELAPLLANESVIDLVAEAGINEWNGSRKPQLLIQDLSISHIQVFDYRGARYPIVKLEELVDKLLHLPSYELRTMATVLSDEVDGLNTSDLKNTPLWVYDNDAGVNPGNEIAVVEGADAVKTLFVLQLPESSHMWNRMMERFGSLERVFLLHPMRKDHEKVQSPSREQFKQVYAVLRQQGYNPIAQEELIVTLVGRTGLSRRMLELTLEVFEELDFVTRTSGTIILNESPSKQPLETSSRYRELGLLAEMEQMLLHGRIPQITEWMHNQMQGQGA